MVKEGASGSPQLGRFATHVERTMGELTALNKNERIEPQWEPTDESRAKGSAGRTTNTNENISSDDLDSEAPQGSAATNGHNKTRITDKEDHLQIDHYKM